MKSAPRLDFEDETRALDPEDRPHYHLSITHTDCLALSRGTVTPELAASALLMIRAWDKAYDPSAA